MSDAIMGALIGGFFAIFAALVTWYLTRRDKKEWDRVIGELKESHNEEKSKFAEELEEAYTNLKNTTSRIQDMNQEIMNLNERLGRYKDLEDDLKKQIETITDQLEQYKKDMQGVQLHSQREAQNMVSTITELERDLAIEKAHNDALIKYIRWADQTINILKEHTEQDDLSIIDPPDLPKGVLNG